MSRWISTLACALVVTLSTGALAAADPARSSAAPLSGAPASALPETFKDTLKQHRDRRDYRDRHRYHDRDRRDYRDHRGYRDRRAHHDHRYRDRRGAWHRPHYAPPRCWREQRHDRFRGRPAVVSLRIYRDGYGRLYVDQGSRRLVYYVSRRHHRDRW